MASDYKQLVRDNVLDEEFFINATFTGHQRKHTLPWLKVVIRPVELKGKRYLQFSYFEPDKDITKNYTGDEVKEKLDQLLALPFKGINLKTKTGNLHVQFTKKGKAIVHKTTAPAPQKGPDLAHDRQKELLLPATAPNPFLQTIGLMTKDGKIKAGMQGKLKQINEFLKLVQQTGELEKFDKTPLYLVDFGCGSAYLTFAIYHYLNHMVGLPTQVTGVDLKADLLKKQAEQVQALGWTNLTFQTTSIMDFEPETPPDLVLALHACDTATDEALARAITWQSKLIFCAPCCHHHLQQQLNQQPAPAPFKPVMRHGILKERQGDILTDTFRALILRIRGYRTEVVEFVSPEHTSKNLMIRAVKVAASGEARFVQEYKALKQFWGVEPYLEQLLAGEKPIF
ncbi:MAG: SAM-dependent methyltransferase [Anaerolineae bacterium]|nr:SAM-dependent methyltransferase [Anaerolineae bacterium]